MRKVDYDRAIKVAWAVVEEYRTEEHNMRAVSDNLSLEGDMGHADIALEHSKRAAHRAEGAERIIRAIQYAMTHN